MSKWNRGALIALIVIDSYLSGVHWAHQPVASCPETGLVDCQAALTGPGSVVLGWPLATWGVLWGMAGWWVAGRAGHIRTFWHLAGLLGLAWAGGHEVLDSHLCLWCSAAQLSILLALATSLDWRRARIRWRHGFQSLRAATGGPGELDCCHWPVLSVIRSGSTPIRGAFWSLWASCGASPAPGSRL